MKLCIRHYIEESTHHANFGSNQYSGGFSHIGEILPLCDFLSFTFSGACPGQTAEPIFTLYGSNDMSPSKEVPFGGEDDAWRHLGEICPQNSQIWLRIGNFKPKQRNIKIPISPKL